MEPAGEGWLLIENHCPICAAARKCQGFCRSELQIFRAAMGDDALVERCEHLISGDRRCVYNIQPRT
jgi:predicted ArsR family transcriptional regulator